MQTLPQKRKNRPQRTIYLMFGCLSSLLLLIVGALIGGVPVLLYYNSPTHQAIFTQHAISLQQTAVALQNAITSVEETANAYQERLNSLQVRATELELDSQGTQMALNSQRLLLLQTATQSANQISATTTAQAAQSSRQRTQIALDYTTTQVALSQNATQVALSFAATQSALGQNPFIITTPLAPSTSLSDSFDAGLSADVWEFDATAWQIRNGDLVALSDLVSLRTRRADFSTYRVNLQLMPPANQTSLAMWLNMPPNGGESVGLRLWYDGNAFRTIDVHRLRDGITLEVIQSRPLNHVGNRPLNMAVQVSTDLLFVTLDDVTVLTYVLNAPLPTGQLGWQLSAETALSAIEIIPIP